MTNKLGIAAIICITLYLVVVQVTYWNYRIALIENGYTQKTLKGSAYPQWVKE